MPENFIQIAACFCVLALVLRQFFRSADESPIAAVRDRTTGRYLYAQYGTSLSGARLTNRDLQGAALAGRDLTDADLGCAHLVSADLTATNLTGANLRKANLTEAVLTGARLTNADLSGATLYRASLERTNLEGADLSGVDLRFVGGGPGALRQVKLQGARCDAGTRWPKGFDPRAAGCVCLSPAIPEASEREAASPPLRKAA